MSRHAGFLIALSVALFAGCSASLSGQPSWFPLGPEVYHESETEQAQKEVLSFRAEPRWFLRFSKLGTKQEYDAWRKEQEARERARGDRLLSQMEPMTTADDFYLIPRPFKYPESIDDLPLADRGASLTLRVEATDDPNVLRFTLTLKAGDRDLRREKEHRWTNAVPFLFAFFADGKAIRGELHEWGREGGVAALYPLVDAQGSRTWELRVDARSIDALLGEGGAQTLDIVAAFSERQHEAHFPDDEGRARLAQEMLPPEGATGPQLVIRSEAVRLKREGNGWVSAAR